MGSTEARRTRSTGLKQAKKPLAATASGITKNINTAPMYLITQSAAGQIADVCANKARNKVSDGAGH
jgi:hypothetical protein